MKPFRKHVAIAVDGGGIKGVIGITEATERIESTEGASVSSVSFSVFSDSNLGRWLEARLIAATDRLIDLAVEERR